MKIVITGGGGFIGLKLAKALLARGSSRSPGTFLNSLKHVRPSHLLGRGAFDFERLPPSRATADSGL